MTIDDPLYFSPSNIYLFVWIICSYNFFMESNVHSCHYNAQREIVSINVTVPQYNSLENRHILGGLYNGT